MREHSNSRQKYIPLIALSSDLNFLGTPAADSDYTVESPCVAIVSSDA